MNCESQVCTFEYAKRLKELNVKQKSIFYWDWYSDTAYMAKFASYPCTGNEKYSAFTITELMAMLPKSFYFQIEFDAQSNWMIHFWIKENDHAIPLNDKSLSDLIAKTIIYLLENNLMQLPQETK